jgi:ribonuclease D
LDYFGADGVTCDSYVSLFSETRLVVKPTLPPAIHIDTDEKLQKLVRELKNEPLLALDTESNSLYAYHTRTCLIQLSTRQQDYIIDPFAITDMQPLGTLLADEHIEKVFHAAEYDLICMHRDFGFVVHNLFDTMYAARLIHINRFGLGDLLERFFKVTVDKSHQTDNWGTRPLKQDSLIYAQMDTHYLPQLRDTLRAELEKLHRLDEAQEVFKDVLRVEVRENGFDPEGFWKLGAPNALTRRQMAILRELYLLRDAIARDEDTPPFKIFNNNVMVSIARSQPQNYTDLYDTKGLSPRYVRQWGDDLLDAIQHGRSNRLPTRPQLERPDPIMAERYALLHTWRKEVGEKRGLDSSLILARQTLWELAEKMPQTKDDLRKIEGIGKWRLEHYGDELLKLIATMT